eukprot:6213634-Pleurochrysis_carterae.AAC.1
MALIGGCGSPTVARSRRLGAPFFWGSASLDLRNSRSKAAHGPRRSIRPTQLNHARLSRRALQNLILYTGNLPELTSGRAGADDHI